MLKLDNNLLEELGLGSLPEDQKRAMLQHIYETLELRVGTNLANQMTDQQLEEFEKFIDEGGDANQAQALQWLETNLPNYKQVVNDVFEQLKIEIKQMAPQLVATSQQQAVAPQAGQGTMPADAPAAPYQPPQPQQTQYNQPQSQPYVQAQPQAQPYAAPQVPPAPDPYAMPQQAAQPQYQQQQPYQPAPGFPTPPAGGYQPAPQDFQPPESPAQQPPQAA